MNSLILVALLLCCGRGGGFNCGGNCGNNGNSNNCGWFGGCLGGNNGCGNRDDDCGCGNNGGRRERQDNDDCGCRPDFRPEPRFEQRPFLFNQSVDCGCEEPQNNGCDCDR